MAMVTGTQRMVTSKPDYKRLARCLIEYALYDLSSKYNNGIPKWSWRDDAEAFFRRREGLRYWCEVAELDYLTVKLAASLIIAERDEREELEGVETRMFKRVER